MKSFNKKASFFLATFVFLLVFSHPQAYAGSGMGRGPIQKFTRGIVYIVASPFQLPKSMIQVAAETDPVYFAPLRGLSVGLGTGLYEGVRQLIAGCWDIFTFWTPAGRKWGPLFDTSLIPEV